MITATLDGFALWIIWRHRGDKRERRADLAYSGPAEMRIFMRHRVPDSCLDKAVQELSTHFGNSTEYMYCILPSQSTGKRSLIKDRVRS